MTGQEIRQAFSAKARSQIGTLEDLGRDNRGATVDEYNRVLNTSVGHAWCAAFVAWCLRKTEAEHDRTCGLILSEHVLTLWRDNPSARVGKLQAGTGDIAIWKIGNKGFGHCGIVVTEINQHTGRFSTVEGNTSDDPKRGAAKRDAEMNRDGDGVFLKSVRTINGQTNAHFQLLGFLRPWRA